MTVLPRDLAKPLEARDYYCGYYSYGDCSSPWYAWQRWVVLGVLLVAAAILILGCACFSARRRRGRGLSPYYGTAWAAPPPAYDVHNIGNNPSTGPQYGGHTYASHTYNTGFNPSGSPPEYAPGGAAGGYYGHQSPPPRGGYEMNNFGGGSANIGPYIPPRPEEAHTVKH